MVALEHTLIQQLVQQVNLALIVALHLLASMVLKMLVMVVGVTTVRVASQMAALIASVGQ